MGIVGIVHGSVSALLYFVMGRRDRGQGLTLHGIVEGQVQTTSCLTPAAKGVSAQKEDPSRTGANPVCQ